ncbi:hypothetical protein NAEGRDRAFT_82024 [Naegleria gruberi]|uniref:Uncharacterized protein n=1 Tax=Naegleria gruberi TaxID=5762 RepID=D2W1F5_NAEGR|nr:uncharacterized protein NAEGRDRAFT_82024 [Naegleria gruberi]EFC37081.1 hypothetical protein NAEGRDRAFT_82024 [Naegleria gruberi]|eukprot:XP_002669825.1 hypothetical protein NAEGRDRAFT_82024 [Naegleria gruberi strain NEG-M]
MKNLFLAGCLVVLLFVVTQVTAIYTPTNACVAHSFSCCPNIDFKVNVDYIKDLEGSVCKEIAAFAASPENVSKECLAAHIEYTCLKKIPKCVSDSNRHVNQLSRSVCVKRQQICLAHKSKNILYFESLCPSFYSASDSSSEIFDNLADEVIMEAFDEEEEFDQEEE